MLPNASLAQTSADRHLADRPLRQAGSLTAEVRAGLANGWKPIFQQIASAQHPANIVA